MEVRAGLDVNLKRTGSYVPDGAEAVLRRA